MHFYVHSSGAHLPEPPPLADTPRLGLDTRRRRTRVARGNMEGGDRERHLGRVFCLPLCAANPRDGGPLLVGACGRDPASLQSLSHATHLETSQHGYQGSDYRFRQG